jgi:2-methylcitrate dehydratase PrpD
MGMSNPLARPITRELAALAVRSRYGALPELVQKEAARTFLNWMGCVLGGCHELAVEMAAAVSVDAGGSAQASLIGHRLKTDMASAAFVNCMSSSILAFDDTHLATVTHPTGPVASALFAYCEQHAVSGEEFANALALGIEIQCRMSNVLLMPPARSNLGFFITGVTGPIGAAAAVARVMRLDEDAMVSAIGLAAAQASGFRSTHGSMAGAFVPAHAARCGMSAALLAAKGFTCSEATLEGGKGFVDVFASDSNLDLAVDGFGQHFELLANAYKPYPCGIVIHAAIDACLELNGQVPQGASIASVKLQVHPLTLSLTDRPRPKTPLEAQISLYHWAAACFVQRSAGVAQAQQRCIDDPGVVAMRGRISAVADPGLKRDEAVAEAILQDGTVLRAHVEHARGSIHRPMTDTELDDKFDRQASALLPLAARIQLAKDCRNIAALSDVGHEITSILSRGQP